MTPYWLKPPKKIEPSPEIKEGDIMVCKEFGAFWHRIQIVRIGRSGIKCLYRFLVAGGKQTTEVSYHEADLSFITRGFEKEKKVEPPLAEFNYREF